MFLDRNWGTRFFKWNLGIENDKNGDSERHISMERSHSDFYIKDQNYINVVRKISSKFGVSKIYFSSEVGERGPKSYQNPWGDQSPTHCG